MARAPSSNSPIPVTGVSEVVLEVVDLDRALRFYSEVLGLPVISRREDGERAWLMAGIGTRIGLWRPQVGIAGGRGGVHVHYAFHLDDGAYDNAVARLRSFGYEPEEHAFDDQGRAAYVDDPDGNVVELWTWDVAGHLACREGGAEGRAGFSAGNSAARSPAATRQAGSRCQPPTARSGRMG